MRQIFVRFSGCFLTCDYCDTPESRVRSSEFIVHSLERGATVTFPNPVSSEDLTEIIDSLQPHPAFNHSISLTGGEPLEQADFLQEWLPEIRTRTGIKVYLETNGLLPDNLSGVVDLVDMIGMDIKLPSVAGVKSLWDQHREFLKIASKKEVFVKVVVSKKMSGEDMDKALEIVSSVNPKIPFIIQPQTPIDLNDDELLSLHAVASERLSNVRVIPQVHKLLNIK